MAQIISDTLKHNEKTRTATSIIGEFGEREAIRFLRKNNFRIIAANFRVPVGRNRRGVLITGEIDIVALEKNTVCFIEVKTRTSADFASPESAVNLRKQRQITRTARVYRKTFNLQRTKFRYDVVSVILNETKAPQIKLYRNFWQEDKFKKKFWADRL